MQYENIRSPVPRRLEAIPEEVDLSQRGFAGWKFVLSLA
jgi:hypothetical protein